VMRILGKVVRWFSARLQKRHVSQCWWTLVGWWYVSIYEIMLRPRQGVEPFWRRSMRKMLVESS
jgi:hypothetical protein